MATKLLVTLRNQDEARTVHDSGMEVLAEYPDSMLVRGTDEQAQRLVEQGIEADTLAEQPVRVTGTSFAFEDAVRAQEAVALEPQAGRTAYYLARLAGPPAPDWLQALGVRGVQVHSNLAGFTLLVGMLPERVDEVRAEPWVEDITPYRPAMKVSPKLRPAPGGTWTPNTLESVAVDESTTRRMSRGVVFPGDKSVNEGPRGSARPAARSTTLQRVAGGHGHLLEPSPSWPTCRASWGSCRSPPRAPQRQAKL